MEKNYLNKIEKKKKSQKKITFFSVFLARCRIFENVRNMLVPLISSNYYVEYDQSW